MLLFVSLFYLVNAFLVYDDLSEPPKENFTQWLAYNMSENHSNRQPTQPPYMWTNITIQIPDFAVSAQLTSKYYYEKKSRVDQEIPFYAVRYSQKDDQGSSFRKDFDQVSLLHKDFNEYFLPLYRCITNLVWKTLDIICRLGIIISFILNFNYYFR
jgi:hypothetical protein